MVQKTVITSFRCSEYSDSFWAKHDIDLTKAKRRNSRESSGVWIRNNEEAWKIFSSTDNMGKLKAAYDSANNARLPMPPYWFISGRVTRSDSGVKAGFALVTTYLRKGHFFAFNQKNTGFSNRINSITDDNILSTIESGLLAAHRAGLIDPQGYLDTKSRDYPLMFIDIHTAKSPSPCIETMREVVSTRRRALLQRKYR